MSEVDKVGVHSVPCVFELSELFEVGFHGGVVGDVGVLVEGVFGFFDRFVHGGDGRSVSLGLRCVVCPSGQSDQGRFDLVEGGGSGDYDVGLSLEEHYSFLVGRLPSLRAGLVFVFG